MFSICRCLCYLQNLILGGLVVAVGNREKYLKWDGGGGGVIEESFEKHLDIVSG